MTPIKDYALIGNCETAALINPNGGIDWLCLPAFDSPSLFGRLLDDGKGGDFAVCPTERFEVARAYADDSAILETVFSTATGSVRLTDFFVIARDAKARFYDFTSLHPTRKLVRLIEWVRGEPVEMELHIRARPDYARGKPAWRKLSASAFALSEATLFTNGPIDENGPDLTARFSVSEGHPFFAVLDYTDERPAPELATVRRWLETTAAFWHEWNLFNYYRGPHQKMVRRSAVTLKLLTYAKTGAFVAAPTTSLPEIAGGDANWDYRYTWVRDTALFIQTLFGLGYSGEAKAFLNFAVKKWMERSEREGTGPDAVTADVLYPIDDKPVTGDEFLKHLAGYGGATPVRTGNRAKDQFQLDNYGYLLQSLFFYRHTGGKIDADRRKMTERLTAEVMRFWQKDDNGIWEESETHAFTYGTTMCWTALQRARDLLGDADGTFAKTCAAIEREVTERGVCELDERKILSAMLDEPALDAASLLTFTIGFLPEHIATATRAAIETKLARGALLYRNEGGVGKEGAFVICSFWWVNHLIREGKLTRAEELLERVLAMASPLGLFSEEIDPTTGEFLGNFPQAFSHMGLIQSVLNLEGAKKERGFYRLPDHQKFQRSVGATIGFKGVIAGFFRVPRTGLLFFSRRSKWRE